MKSSSDHYPELTTISNGKTQVRYNILETTKEDMNGSRTVYDFDYVEIEGEVDKEKIIAAILTAEKPAEPEPEPEILEPEILEVEILEEKPDITEMVTGAVTEAKVIVEQGPEAIKEVLAVKQVVEPVEKESEIVVKEVIEDAK